MLSLVKFPLQTQCNSAIVHNAPAKTHQIQLFSYYMRVTQVSLYGVFGQKRTEFCICVQRKRGNNLLEMEKFDKDDDFLEVKSDKDEDLGDGDEDLSEGDEDDDVFIPLNNMKKWLENKPSGFGEDKVYDTSIEDKLMEEIEQSKKAQLANINELKNNLVKPNSKKEQVQHKKVSEEHNGFHVRLVNLPKKKNIHKDLHLAFKGVPGIVDIVPVVSGNKRTRDPICKGLAYVYFRSDNDVHRFVQNFSGQSITFGKVQKQINCEINTGLLKPGCEQSVDETSFTSQLAVSSLNSLAENTSRQFESEDEMHAAQPDNGEDLRTEYQPESKCGGNPEVREGSIVESSSLKQKGEFPVKEKKVASKRTNKKVLKMNSLGSANRLKIREKALLKDAFSKYGANASLAMSKES